MTRKQVVRTVLAVLRNYFRVQVRGLENIPKRGRVLVYANHSGYAGADAVVLAHIIRRDLKRRARILAHRAYFDVSKGLKRVAEEFGLRRAGMRSGVEILEKDHILMIFPEGEAGNFKSSLKSYRLTKFHTGFLRMALKTGSPLVPCVIIGSEESFLNLGSLNLGRFVKNLRVPLPVNLIPLPAKWYMEFLPALDFVALTGMTQEEFAAKRGENERSLKALAEKIRKHLQKELIIRARQRPYRFSRRLSGFVRKVSRTVKTAKV